LFTSKTMRKLVQTAGLVIGLLAIFFLVRSLVANFDRVPEIIWDSKSLAIVFLAVVAVILQTVMAAFAWKVLLVPSGRIALQLAFAIFGKAQIARYVPGNIFHIVGQYSLSRQRGLAADATSLSMSALLASSAAAALAMSLIGVIFDHEVIASAASSFVTGRTIAVVLIVFALLALTALIGLVRSAKIRTWLTKRKAYFNPGRLLFAISVFIVIFVMQGVIIQLLINVLWSLDIHVSLFQLTWGFALAWLLGFLTPGAPGGLGIREAVFVFMFAPVMGDSLAIGLAFMLRVITALGDLGSFILASIVDDGKPRQSNINESVDRHRST